MLVESTHGHSHRAVICSRERNRYFLDSNGLQRDVDRQRRHQEEVLSLGQDPSRCVAGLASKFSFEVLIVKKLAFEAENDNRLLAINFPFEEVDM